MTCLWPVSVCAAPLGVVVGRWRTRLLGRPRKLRRQSFSRDATFGRPKCLHGLASTDRGKRHGYRRCGTSRKDLLLPRGSAAPPLGGNRRLICEASFGHRRRGNSAPEGRGEPTYSASAVRWLRPRWTGDEANRARCAKLRGSCRWSARKGGLRVMPWVALQ